MTHKHSTWAFTVPWSLSATVNRCGSRAHCVFPPTYCCLAPQVSRREAFQFFFTAVALSSCFSTLAANAAESIATGHLKQPSSQTHALDNEDTKNGKRSPLAALVTDTVFLDFKIGGRPAGRIVIGLFRNDAPISVTNFVKLCNAELRGKGPRTVGYISSTAWRIIRDRRIDLGRVKQIDEINQSPGIPQRQTMLVRVPENGEANDIIHSIPGTVSVRKGGGEFEFTISPSSDNSHDLDNENIVIGRVLSGMDVVEKMNAVPTNRKTIRDGFRDVGRLIGDGRAKLDLEYKPLQKIVVTASGSI